MSYHGLTECEALSRAAAAASGARCAVAGRDRATCFRRRRCDSDHSSNSGGNGEKTHGVRTESGWGG
jgi:hypothetical protein